MACIVLIIALSVSSKRSPFGVSHSTQLPRIIFDWILLARYRYYQYLWFSLPQSIDIINTFKTPWTIKNTIWEKDMLAYEAPISEGAR